MVIGVTNIQPGQYGGKSTKHSSNSKSGGGN